jgi:histidine triad (HIT) family protein
VASIFSKIASKDIPGYFLAENDEFFAILDINPLAKGHTLIIPKLEVDYIFDLPADYLGRYFMFSQNVAKAMGNVLDCERIGVAVIGLEVPHAHIHLVPINNVSDIDFSLPKKTFTVDEMKAVQSDIKSKMVI